MDIIECPCGNKYPSHQHDGGTCHNCGRVLGINKERDERAMALKAVANQPQTLTENERTNLLIDAVGLAMGTPNRDLIDGLFDLPKKKNKHRLDTHGVAETLSDMRFADGIDLNGKIESGIYDIEPVYSLGSDKPVGWEAKSTTRNMAELEREVIKRQKEYERGRAAGNSIPVVDTLIPKKGDQVCHRCKSKMFDNYCAICHLEDYDGVIFDPPLMSTTCEVCGARIKADVCPTCGPVTQIGVQKQTRCGRCGTLLLPQEVCGICKLEPALKEAPRRSTRKMYK